MARTRKRRRRRRRNPIGGIVKAVQTSAKDVLNVDTLTQAAWIGASGAVATGVLAGRLGGLLPSLPSVGGFNLNGLAVSLAVGVTTAAVGSVVSGMVPGQAGKMVAKFAASGTQGALIFGLAAFLAPLTARATAMVPGAGFGAFTSMPLDLEGRVAGGMQGYGDYVKLHDVVPTITPKELQRSAAGSFGSYHRLGDIYGSQKLGAFEREGGLGAFVDESSSYGITAQGNQQVADTAALDQAGITGEGGGTVGGYGSYEGFGAPGQATGAGDFSPLWS